jgi:hypothetical protein
LGIIKKRYVIKMAARSCASRDIVRVKYIIPEAGAGSIAISPAALVRCTNARNYSAYPVSATLDAEDLLTGVITNSGAADAVVLTLPTAEALLAALSVYDIVMAINDSFEFRVERVVADRNITVLPSSTVTFANGVTQVLLGDVIASAMFRVRLDSSTTFSVIYILGN